MGCAALPENVGTVRAFGRVGFGRVGLGRGGNNFSRTGFSRRGLRLCILHLLLQRGDLRLRRRLLGLHLRLQGLDRRLKLIRIGGIGAARSSDKNAKHACTRKQITVQFSQSVDHLSLSVFPTCVGTYNSTE